MSIGRLKTMNIFTRRESCPSILATLCSREETRSSSALIALPRLSISSFVALLRFSMPSFVALLRLSISSFVAIFLDRATSTALLSSSKSCLPTDTPSP
jgi:hypothetical protein